MKQHGLALTEVLIASAIMGVILMAMAGMFQGQVRETQALSEKLAALDFQRTLTGAISIAASCSKDVSPSNLAPGQSVVFNPASITTTDRNNPQVIAKFVKVYGMDGTTVLADSTVPVPLSPMSSHLKLSPSNALQLSAYKDATSGNLVFVLMIAFDNTALVHPIHNLAMIVNATTAPDMGTNLKVTGCVGASSGSATSASQGAICGSRLVICNSPGAPIYDQRCDGFACFVKSSNVPCQGTTLTATCSSAPDPYGYGNVFVVGVSGCPAGWSWGHTMLNPATGGGMSVSEIANIFCKKD